MDCHVTKMVNMTLDKATVLTIEALNRYDFNVLATMDVDEGSRERLGIALQPCLLVRARNARLDRDGSHVRSEAGMLMPCSILLQQHKPDRIEVCAVDPVKSVPSAGSAELDQAARDVRVLLQCVIDEIG